MHQCIVYGCQNLGRHLFPTDEKTRKQWEELVGREPNYKAGKYSRLCPAHFKPEDYVTEGFFSGLPSSRLRLKKGSVPSIFTQNTEAKLQAQTRYQNRQLNTTKKSKIKPRSKSEKKLAENDPLLNDLQLFDDEIEVKSENEDENTEDNTTLYDGDYTSNVDTPQQAIIVNFADLCRLCSKPSNRFNLITTKMTKMIIELGFQSTDYADELPKFLCITCSGKLNGYYQFRQSCRTAYFNLCQMVTPAGPETPLEVYIDDETLLLEAPSSTNTTEKPVTKDQSTMTMPITDANIKLAQSMKKNNELVAKIRQLMEKPSKPADGSGTKASSFQYVCNNCKKVFTDFLQYNEHKKTHLVQNVEVKEQMDEGSGLGDVSPEDLKQESFNSPGGVLLNENAIEIEDEGSDSDTQTDTGELRAFVCDYCARRFCSIIELKSHSRIHGDERQSFPCSICNQNFLSFFALKYHEVITHQINVHEC